METRVDLAKILMTPFDCPPPKKKQFGAKIWDLFQIWPDFSKFCVKIADFRYHGNRGWSDTK